MRRRGGNSFYQIEQEQTRVIAPRYEELAATGAERIAVACPHCLTMLRDPAGAQGGEAPEVVDVAEAFLERLRPAVRPAPAAGEQA